MNCTLATELMRAALGVHLDEFDALVNSVEAGADGLSMLPFFNGERTPDLPHASANLIGITTHNCSRAHLLRATVEGTCFALKAGLDTLSGLGLEATTITLTGGGSHSHAWRQIVADIFQLPVTIYQGEQGAAFGAALQALWILQQQDGVTSDLAALCHEHLVLDPEKCMTPDSEKADIYATAYARYQNVLQHLTPLLEKRNI
jgi:xylulokinase